MITHYKNIYDNQCTILAKKQYKTLLCWLDMDNKELDVCFLEEHAERPFIQSRAVTIDEWSWYTIS